MKKILSFLLVFIVTLGLLVGCGTDNSTTAGGDNTDTPETDQTETESEETDKTAFPLTVKDDLDNELSLDEKPKRIVSLIPSNTEIAYALGLGDKIVGVSDYDNYPEEVQEKEKIGGLEINVELIISLEPDLVLAHASSAQSSQGALDQLRNSGINVYVVHDAQDIDGVYKAIGQIGEITGTNEEANEIISNMKQGFAELSEKTAGIPEEEGKSVFFEVSPAPDIFTAGKNTFFDALLNIVHADNAAAELDGWVPIDPESIVELNPDVIITTYGSYVENPEEQVLNREAFDTVSAIQNEQVYDINTDLLSRPGPRLVEGAKEIAKVVYPELFEE